MNNLEIIDLENQVLQDCIQRRGLTDPDQINTFCITWTETYGKKVRDVITLLDRANKEVTVQAVLNHMHAA